MTDQVPDTHSTPPATEPTADDGPLTPGPEDLQNILESEFQRAAPLVLADLNFARGGQRFTGFAVHQALYRVLARVDDDAGRPLGAADGPAERGCHRLLPAGHPAGLPHRLRRARVADAGGQGGRGHRLL